MKFKFIHIVCLLFVCQFGFGQLKIIATPDSLATNRYFNLHQSIADEVLLKEYLATKIDSLYKVGYLASSVDSLTVVNDTVKVQLFLGERIEKVELQNGNIEEAIFQQYNPKHYTTWQSINQLRADIQQRYLKEGFLNSETYFDAVDYKADKITLQLFSKKGEQYKFNKFIINGDVAIEEEYLLHLFNIEENEIVTSETLQKIERVAGGSSYFELKESPRLGLNEFGFADIYLDLKNKKANQFDLLIGILPNAVTNNTTTAKKTRVTGEGVLKLVNPFGRGRELGVNYKQLQPESPILNGNAYLPRIFKQPFGLRGNFNLEKQDTSFLNLEFSAKFDYKFGQNQHFLVGYQSGSSFLQNVDTVQVKQTKLLPASSDYNLNLYQLGYTNNTLNKTIAPTKGFQLQTDLAVGSKTIKPNNSVINIADATFDYSILYDEVNDEKMVLIGEVFGQYFIPIKGNSTVLVQTNSAYKSLNQYFENDMYRLGGINTIRGFDERSHLASMYSINTLEYRLLLNQNSFFSVFTDLGYTQNELTKKNDFLTGLGTGLDLETKAGIFAINLAVGRNKDLPFEFNRSRIHFSYVNVF